MSTDAMTDATRRRFRHEAFFYGSDSEYLSRLVPLIEESVSGGEPVLVAVPAEKLRLLRDALGEDADRVEMVDMTVTGRNPGRVLSLLCAFADRHSGVHIRLIDEPVWPGRSGIEYPACAEHDALLNTAFQGRDVDIICPFDIGLEASVLADAKATHPTLWEAGTRRASDRYDPDSVSAHHNTPLACGEDAAAYTATTVHNVPEARRFATEHAGRLGLSADRIADLALIATELVTNSLTHANSSSRLRLWRDGDYLVCEVRDSGHIADPLAGRVPPAPDQPSGRGLLLVHNLADLVRTHTGTGGTTIHAHLQLDGK